MIKRAAVLSLVMLGTVVFAQAEAQAVGPDAELARIGVERSRLEAVFLTEGRACYQRFAVNNCLDDVNERRREAMANLRRQEILLNEQERKRRGAEQIRKTEEKVSAENQQADAERRAKAASDYQSRVGQAKEKQESRTRDQDAEKVNSEARAARLRANQQKTQSRSARQADETAETAKFNARQKEAQEKRAQHESERLKRAKPPAMSLPLLQ